MSQLREANAADGFHPVDPYEYVRTDETPAERTDREDGPTTITSLTPSTLVAGNVLSLCAVAGTGFKQGCKVTWNGVDQVTTWHSATSVDFVPTVTTPTVGTYQVGVRNPSGERSNTKPFTVTAAE